MANSTESILKNLSKKYRKMEKYESQSRQRKQERIMPQADIQKIFDCTKVKDVMEQAVRSFKDDTLRCYSRSDFTKLRNTLITSMMI